MDDISNAYSKGDITELHYNLLNERISNISLNETGVTEDFKVS